jgi:hypothetical protein
MPEYDAKIENRREVTANPIDLRMLSITEQPKFNPNLWYMLLPKLND